MFQKNLSPRYSAVRDAAGFISSILFNNLLGIQTIKSFIQENTEIQRVNKISKIYQHKNKCQNSGHKILKISKVENRLEIGQCILKLYPFL